MAGDSARVLRKEGLRTRTQAKAFLLRSILEGKKRRKRLETFLHAVVARRKFLLNLCIIGLLLSLSQKIATPLYNCSCEDSREMLDRLTWSGPSIPMHALKRASESCVQHFSLYCNALDMSWIEVL